MSDEVDRWKKLALNAIGQRSQRDVRRERAVRHLEPDWSDWSQQEREVYACAFLFPAPAEPLIDGITINGEHLNLAKYARTATIIDATGGVWRVVEHGKPEKL